MIHIASAKSEKAKKWIEGRKNLLNRLEKHRSDSGKNVWFHFASLGEFEQGRPVLEELKSRFPDYRIFITFFSPSGYEIRKNYELAECITYLPLDTRNNAAEFIRIVQPAFAVFTKYEYWYHYFNELYKNHIPLFMVSALFRPAQPFFKWYGALHRDMLRKVSHFFVQDEHSKAMLEQLGLANVSAVGDSRFDRVVKHVAQVKPIGKIKQFCGESPVLIAGSTWQPDEALLKELPERYPDWKFIVAPHEVDAGRIQEVKKAFKDSVLYSESTPASGTNQVLIIDNVGMLSSIYQYGTIAYIGGGFGVGIHNTQEAAAFGLPVIFGPNYNKFREARDLVAAGAFFSVADADALLLVMKNLTADNRASELGQVACDYAFSQSGATEKIVEFLIAEGVLKGD